MWADIDGFAGYKVSDSGQVMHNDKLMKPFKSGTYYQISLFKSGVRSTYGVHVLVAKSFISNPDSKPQVNHIDNNGQNNNVTNLEWCTVSENLLHATRVTMTMKPWNKGKVLVNRNRLCEYCKEIFKYRKLHQRFCSNHCSQQARLAVVQAGRVYQMISLNDKEQ